MANALQDLLRQVRRRYLSNLVLEQAGLALCVGVGALILLLVLGTQILNWYWPILLALITLAIGVFRTVRRVPSQYRLAQIADRRLGLHDALSTAHYFAHPDSGIRFSEDIRQAQGRQAEDLARSVDARAAFPAVFPRSLYATAALGMLAFGMVAVRYGIQNSLDLRRPMVENVAELLFGGKDQLAALKEEQRRRPEDPFRPMEIAMQTPDTDGVEGEKQPDSLGNETNTPDTSNAAAKTGDPKDNSELPQNSTEAEGDEAEEGSEEGERSKDGADRAASEQGEPNADGNQSSPSESQKGQPGENSSLLDKMRDAMANLMAKLKIPQTPSAGRQMESTKSSGSKSSAGQKASKKQGSPMPGQSQSEGEPSANPQGQQQGEGSQTAQNAQAGSGQQSSDRPSSPDARSGMGKDDGAKDLREAQQLEAMGKLSEIIGKRQANVTGEVMVEVPSGKQQLRTRYADKRATHMEATGDIHRDEVPLLLQPYVQQYFEEVRKSEPAARGARN